MTMNLRHAAVASHLGPRGATRPTVPMTTLAAVAALAMAGWALPAQSQVAASVSSPAAPADAARDYDLPAAPLAETLAAIQQRSGQRVVFDLQAVARLRSQPVTGLHTGESAVAAALSGSGLVAVRATRDELRVVADSASLVAPVVVLAKRDQAEVSFKADRSATTARTGASLMDTPMGVTVITSKVLESQQVRSVEEALYNVSSLVVRPSSQGPSSYTIRGMNATALANGTSSTIGTTSTASTNIATVERIEVLKGPQAILSGAESMSGAVNVVTKKPQVDPLRELMLQYGSHGDLTVAGDLSGAISDDKRLSYRLIASHAQAQSSPGGYDGRKDQVFMPQLRWKDGSTDLTVGLSSTRQHFAPNLWLPTNKGQYLPEPRHRPGNADDGIDVGADKLFYDLEQRLSPMFTLVSRMQQERSTQGMRQYLPLDIDGSNKVLFMGSDQASTYKTLSGDHYLRAAFSTGPVEHKLATGFNHIRSDISIDYYKHASFFTVPIYADAAYPYAAFGKTLEQHYSGPFEQTGAFVQDLMRWGDTSVLAGLRRSKWLDGPFDTLWVGSAPSTFPQEKASHTSKSLGVVHALTPEVSLYANVVDGFAPQFMQLCPATKPVTNSFAPQESQNKEVGAKFDLLGSKLAVTAAYFDLKQTNTALYDPAGDCNRLIAGQQTKGLDLDIQGELSKRWSVIFSYTNSTTKDTSNPSRVFNGQPRQQASLWSTYQLPMAAWQEVKLGLGMTAHSRTTAGDPDYSGVVDVSGWVSTDANISYQGNKWSATLGVKNLFDKKIFQFSGVTTYIPVAPGRTALLTLRRSFD